jgi:FkbM family methyltransferase
MITSFFKEYVKNLLRKYNYKIISYNFYINNKQFKQDIKNLLSLNTNKLIKLLKIYQSKKNQSELNQDLFVLLESNFKKRGYFVEIGGADGKVHSNTFFLEKKYDWKGIVVEPAIINKKNLQKNRNCNICFNAVHEYTDVKLDFLETKNPNLSQLTKYNKIDGHNRSDYKKYQVSTISLMDLLIKYKAPRIIDYLSIDTEGAEYDILKKFNFNKYKIKIITIEHNYNKNRDKIYHLLKKNNYCRKFSGISDYDDWYVKIN